MTNKKLHVAELKVADQFVNICNENNLVYYMLGGTLLGAVRHKGFIPWDDDMDFGMPRQDYEKLLKLLSNKYKNDFSLKHYSFTKSHDYQLKLESKEVEIIHNGEIKKPWIDILPLDGMPNNLLLRKLHSLNLLQKRSSYKISHLSNNVAKFNPYRTRTEKIIIFFAKCFSLETFLDEEKQLIKLDRALKKYSYTTSDYVINFMGAYKLKEMFPKKIYEDLILYPFENKKFIGPRDFDTVLNQLYGDYMVPPSEDKKNKHSTTLVK